MMMMRGDDAGVSDTIIEPLAIRIMEACIQFVLRKIRLLWPFYLLVLFLGFLLPTIIGLSSGVHQYYARWLRRLFLYVNTLLTSPNDNFRINRKSGEICKIELAPTSKKPFEITDACPVITSAITAIVDDNVTKRFSSEELSLWNMMGRSCPDYISNTLTLHFIWWIGAVFRYFILLPNRFIMWFISLNYVIFTGLLYAALPRHLMHRSIGEYFTLIMCRMSIASFGINVNVGGRENIPTSGILVANHTTPIDAVILSSVRFFRMVGQQQSGYFGVVQKVLTKAGHIFFDRNEELDRKNIYHALGVHANDREKPPIILFPEGTCINNTSVMMFRKGAFEATNVVYPVAIKYSSLYGDAFWNSSQQSFLTYSFRLMSSWMIWCNVWFLPPVTRFSGESSIEFAARTRSIIARRAKLVELDWDGNLKRTAIPPRLREAIQAKHAESIVMPKLPIQISATPSSSFPPSQAIEGSLDSRNLAVNGCKNSSSPLSLPQNPISRCDTAETTSSCTLYENGVTKKEHIPRAD